MSKMFDELQNWHFHGVLERITETLAKGLPKNEKYVKSERARGKEFS